MTIDSNPTRRAQLRESRQRDSRRSQAIWALGAAAFILLVTAAAILTPRSESISRAEIGSPISNFSLVDLNGATHQMANLKGRVVLINAWATWCPPCRAEMPALQEFYQAYEKQGFTLLAVNAGEDAATAEAFIEQMGFTFPVLLDPGTNVLVGLGIDAFPTSILIDRNGAVATIHVGYYDPADVAADVLPLLSQ